MKEKDYEKNAENFVNQEEGSEQTQEDQAKPQTSKTQKDIDTTKISAPDIGFINVPIEDLPSQGLFYPNDFKISIRAAKVKEIKHWSAMDSNDFRSIDESINFVLQNCTKLRCGNNIVSWKDIKEIDRLYLIFAIREFTFKDGENKLYLPGSEKIEIRKEMLKYFELNEKLKKFYCEKNKCFIITNKNNKQESVKLYIPSIGVSQFIKDHVDTKRQNQETVDEDFLKFAPFIFSDHRELDEKKYFDALVDSNGWSIWKISAIGQVSDIIMNNVKPQVVYTKGGEEHNAPLNFQGGFKSIFLVSDIFD